MAAKAKAKAIASKFSVPEPVETPVKPEIVKPEPSAQKSTIADWAATGSDDDWNQPEKRQRGGRKKRKKNRDGPAEIVQNWDDIYDPSRPNNYEEYKHSEEKILEVREWKDLLYRHRMKRRKPTRSDSGESERPMNSKPGSDTTKMSLTMLGRFAPPMSFAPPSNLNKAPPPPPEEVSDDDPYARRMQMTEAPPPPRPDVPNDATGEDAYARRLRMSQQPPPPPAQIPPPPSSVPSPPPSSVITRAPVRYSLPPPPAEIPATEAELKETLAEQPKSSRPGQAGFAERLLSKYGWSKGQGLGVNSDGIINPLYAKADKRKKKADVEGGGFVTPATTGKILGGNKSKSAQEEEGRFGGMSEVIKLEHMLDGMDLDEELSRGEGGIMQEIGEECGEKYGSVERVYIHRGESPLVFVSFVSQLSALRAVNALEGRVFGGNTIVARFWSKEKFEAGEYE